MSSRKQGLCRQWRSWAVLGWGRGKEGTGGGEGGMQENILHASYNPGVGLTMPLKTCPRAIG